MADNFDGKFDSMTKREMLRQIREGISRHINDLTDDPFHELAIIDDGDIGKVIMFNYEGTDWMLILQEV